MKAKLDLCTWMTLGTKREFRGRIMKVLLLELPRSSSTMGDSRSSTEVQRQPRFDFRRPKASGSLLVGFLRFSVVE